MGHRFSEIAFTNSVQAIQRTQGSREVYARREALAEPGDRLGPDERNFIEDRDGFYIASVSETGWPYVQFRGGPRGFVKVLGESNLGFADFRGNRQYVTAGNVIQDERVSLILMDYPNQRRLKLFGRMRGIEREDDLDLVASLAPSEYPSVVERAFLVKIEAFDWNCPRHITPRFSKEEISRDAAIRTELCSVDLRLSSQERLVSSEPKPGRAAADLGVAG